MSRKYDQEFKLNAVKLVQEKRLTCRQVSENLGIALSSLYRCLNEVETYGGSKVFSAKDKFKDRKSGAPLSEARD